MTFASDRDAPNWLLEGETRRRLVGTLAIAGLSVLGVAVLASSVPLPESGSTAVPASTPTARTVGTPTPTPVPAQSLPSIPRGLLLLLATLGLVAGALFVLYRTVGRPSNPTVTPAEAPSDVEQDDRASLDEMAETAGRTADRLERSPGVDVQNEIYRAWREMTADLAVSNPRTRTPGEFAEAAIRAGMSARDVRALTRLFEEVRYGDRNPSEESERRAIELLRRIESTYGEAE